MSDPLSCTLLLFEDDPSIRAMLTTFFTAQGATVEAAADGAGALDRIRAVQPDILLLDVIIPVQDGLSILQSLRAVDRDLPVIMLTEKGGVEDKVTGLEYGADDYMTKPFSPKELLARVRAQLRRSRRVVPPDDPGLQIGAIRIDPAAREVQLAGGGLLPLTKTEFDLMAYLAARPGAVIAHSELLREVLGYDPEAETKALVMHIANIRRKIDRHCPQALTIKAVAGVGYKLIPGEAK
ncbi:MAG: response regulator transcription factor [Desulfobulbus sp.]